MIKLQFFDKKEWAKYSKDFHEVVFDNKEFEKIELIDFACVVFNEGKAIGFCTFKLLDKYHVYMQYGGSLEKNSYNNLKGYLEIIEALKKDFLNITTLIENENIPMLKFAMKAGFKIIGTRTAKNKIYLEHLIEV